MVARRGRVRFAAHYKPKFPLWSTLRVLGIVFVSTALKADDILRIPQVLLGLMLHLVLMFALNVALSTLVGRRFFGRDDAIALVYGTMMRNLSFALAIAIGVFRERSAEAALLIALAYLVQVHAAAWYLRFSDRLFRRPEAELDEENSALRCCNDFDGGPGQCLCIRWERDRIDERRGRELCTVHPVTLDDARHLHAHGAGWHVGSGVWNSCAILRRGFPNCSLRTAAFAFVNRGAACNLTRCSALTGTSGFAIDEHPKRLATSRSHHSGRGPFRCVAGARR